MTVLHNSGIPNRSEFGSYETYGYCQKVVFYSHGLVSLQDGLVEPMHCVLLASLEHFHEDSWHMTRQDKITHREPLCDACLIQKHSVFQCDDFTIWARVLHDH